MHPKSLYRDLMDIPYMHRFVAVDGHTYEARNTAPGTWEMYVANIKKEWYYLDVVHTSKKMPTCMDLYNLLYGGH